MLSTIQSLAEAIQTAGGQALLVGGYVRDRAMGVASKDIDLEVYGLGADHLRALLEGFGRVDAVGASFGVLKLRLSARLQVDVSLPRRENKVGQGHRGFLVAPDPSMTPREAAARRDFTMNSLALDPISGELLDFFGGQRDIADRLLRPTSEAFVEDPLRVLRGMQFAARFDFRPTAELIAAARICLDEYHSLAKERIWGEWEKLALRGRVPSQSLWFLAATGWLAHYAELQALDGCPQQPEYHPEGDVLCHTACVADAAAEIADRDGLVGDDRVVLIFGAMCHDLGKPATTQRDAAGRITAHGHAEAGVAPTQRFLGHLGAPARIVARVVPLVREHMAHVGLDANDIHPRVVRRLAVRLGAESVEMLCRLIEADMNGRPPLPGGLPATAARLREMARQLAVGHQGPQPLLRGRDLLPLGVQPGPNMGLILKQAFEAQLDGVFGDREDALAWARSYLR